MLRILLRRVRLLLQVSILQLYVWISGSGGAVSTASVGELNSSGVLPLRKKARWSQLTQGWSSSDRLWREGHYHQSVSLRRSLLAEAYDLQGVDPSHSAPPLLSAGYSSNVGHLGWLAMHSIARSLGLLPGEQRTAILGPSLGNEILVKSLPRNTSAIAMIGSSAVSDFPAMWPQVERLQMVNTLRDFVDFYSLWEEVVASCKQTSLSPTGFALPADYLARAAARLASVGLPEESWFVGLHLRTLGYPNDPRSVHGGSVIAAIQEVISHGGFVVNFGTNRMEPLVEHPQYLELSSLLERQADLHPYIVQKSEFLLTTNSGPAVVAHILGTDLLQFNTTSIARNSLSSWATAYYLPAVLVDDYGHDKSLLQMFEATSAWWEPTPGSRTARKARLRRSTSDEILSACQDLLRKKGFSSTGYRPDAVLARDLERIRRQTGAVSFGDFAPSFLVRHAERDFQRGRPSEQR